MELINYKNYIDQVLEHHQLSTGDRLEASINQLLNNRSYDLPFGKFECECSQGKPSIQIADGCIQLKRFTKTDGDPSASITKYFESLKPWRKGPYEIDGVQIDAEWDCRIKWDRIEKLVPELSNKSVLDVGANNGYYLFRLLEKNPKLALGIDPHPLYFKQFLALDQWNPFSEVVFLPIGYEQLPTLDINFDLILAMGILYHEKNPLSCLELLKEKIVPGGKIIIESIVVDGEQDFVLFPAGRYAQMKNVYFIPTVSALENWMKKTGFKNVTLISVSTTDSSEQRITKWSSGASLDNFLDPTDKQRTVEGYPAPKRAIFTAERS